VITFFRRQIKVDHIGWLGVDMHNHLLPAIDDGAADAVQSLNLIKGLMNLGFTRLYCTPHVFTEWYPNTAETIYAALAVVKGLLINAGLTVDIHAAAEYMVDETFKAGKGLLCLPGEYVLIEMSYYAELPHIEQLIFELQLMGFSVVLAHPERYSFYHKRPERYRRLKDMGVLFQLNLLSLSGYYGNAVKQCAGYLLKSKSYDLAGTDLHHEYHLQLLQQEVRSGRLYRAIGHYPFKNKELF
jgi:protein-tyrosine phosphatase